MDELLLADTGAAAEEMLRHQPPSVVLLDREKSILAFNRRVLAQARRDEVPLLERLRYITIVSSNLDEFFEVRFADLLDAARLPGTAVTVGEAQAVAAEAQALVKQQYAVFNDEVMPALEQQGLVVLPYSQRNEVQRRWVARFFEEQVQPLLVPVSLDPAHPFPTVANKSLNFIVQLGGLDAFGHENSIAIVKVPRVLPRVIRLPEEVSEGRQAFVLLSSIIRTHLQELFPGRQVLAFSQFRLTRDSDLEVDEDDATNLRQVLRRGLYTRNFGQAVWLEVVQSCPQELVRSLLQQFHLPAWALCRVNGPVNLVRLAQLIDQADARRLRFAPWEPAWPVSLPQGSSMFERLQQGDVLLHHPFESFEPVVQFLREAVADPNVLAIRQTIYRTGTESALMEQLLEAVRRGKEVTVVVELKARFDEEANINWAERLEAVGAQVVYGIVGMKAHAKLLLVTRREGNVLRRYAHLSTGNYNAGTARLYTDLGCMTADPELTADVEAVFRQLTGQVELGALHQLLAAPFALQAAMLAHLKLVAQSAREGRFARVVVKCNALTDPVLMAALVEAGQAGASIDLIIRGACMLPPAVPGLTDNIRVRSVVGRFLEHTRIFYFRWGSGEADEALYLSSADWMSRNMLRRVEVAWPMRDAALRQRVIDECLVPYLHDARDAWALQPDGSYQSLGVPNGAGAQAALMSLYRG